jgi:hypothetical protein
MLIQNIDPVAVDYYFRESVSAIQIGLPNPPEFPFAKTEDLKGLFVKFGIKE